MLAVSDYLLVCILCSICYQALKLPWDRTSILTDSEAIRNQQWKHKFEIGVLLCQLSEPWLLVFIHQLSFHFCPDVNP